MRSFLDNAAISLYKPGVFLYNHKTTVFIILGVLLAVFIVLSILYRRKKIFPLFVTLAVIVGLLLIAQIVHVSVKYKNDATLPTEQIISEFNMVKRERSDKLSNFDQFLSFPSAFHTEVVIG